MEHSRRKATILQHKDSSLLLAAVEVGLGLGAGVALHFRQGQPPDQLCASLASHECALNALTASACRPVRSKPTRRSASCQR